MKVSINVDEAYPVVYVESKPDGKFEIPDDLFAKHNRLKIEWDEIQDKLHDLYIEQGGS